MKTTRVWLALGLVFLAGFAGGILSARTVMRRAVKAAIERPGLVQEKMERRLLRELRLDAGQEAEVREILNKRRAKLKELRGELQPRFRAIMNAARDEISVLLAPGQRGRFEQFLRDHPLAGAGGAGGESME